MAPKASKFVVEDDGFRLRIRWAWFHPLVFGLLLFAIVWNGFLLFWYGMATQMPGPARWIFLLFPIVHIAVGLSMIYGVVTMFLNSTTVTVERGYLTIEHGPVYFPGGVTLETSEIDQLYVASGQTKGKHPTTVYQLNLRTRDNEMRTLVSRLTDSTEALFLEQTLERFLKIQDQRVAGELLHS